MCFLVLNVDLKLATSSLHHSIHAFYYVFSLVGERIFPTGYLPNYRESEGLRFNVVIREDAKVSPFTDVIVNDIIKAALSTHLF